MKLTWPAIITAALLPLSAYAGMYGQPVLHLNSKTFKSVMANEHAAVRLCKHEAYATNDFIDGRLCGTMVWAL